MIRCERNEKTTKTDIRGDLDTVSQELCEIIYQLMMSMSQVADEVRAILQIQECVRAASERLIGSDSDEDSGNGNN